MTPASTFTVVGVTLRLERGGALSEVEIAGSFDGVRTQDAARAVGRAIGAALGDNLALRLQHGEVLS